MPNPLEMLDFCVRGKAISFRAPALVAGLTFTEALGCAAPSAANKWDDRKRPNNPTNKVDNLLLRLLNEGIKVERSLSLNGGKFNAALEPKGPCIQASADSTCHYPDSNRRCGNARDEHIDK